MLGERLTGQIRYLNKLVLHAVDHIIDVDPDATIVVFSDHGLRRDPADMDEWLRTLFAARNQRFPDNVTTLDMFPALLHQIGQRYRQSGSLAALVGLFPDELRVAPHLRAGKSASADLRVVG